MKLAVIAVGRMKETYYRAAFSEYAERIRKYVGFEEHEIEDGPDSKLAPVITKLARGAAIVPLDSRGIEHDSKGFAGVIERLGSTGKGSIAFVIGGKAGLGPESLALGAPVISLSRLTLPHRLARLVLAEQLYRAFTILRNEPYGAAT